MLIELMENGFRIGRRNFIKAAGTAVSLLIVGHRASYKAYAEVKDYITNRIEAVYSHDMVMKFRKSQDNPQVKKLYGDFFPYPYCEKSHKMLHSFYVDRSQELRNIPDAMKRLK